MRERALTIAAVVVALVALGWAIKAHYDRTSADAKARSLFGGDEGAETIRNPDRVVAYRLGGPSGDSDSAFDIQAYSVVAGPIDVPPSTARSVRAILLSDSSYSWEGSKACVPEYGVRITFVRGRDEVDVNFCFGCAQGIVRRDGKPFTSFEFDPSCSQLAALIRPLFPDDPAIQALR